MNIQMLRYEEEEVLEGVENGKEKEAISQGREVEDE